MNAAHWDLQTAFSNGVGIRRELYNSESARPHERGPIMLHEYCTDVCPRENGAQTVIARVPTCPEM
jgi:hypothetical protein